MNEMMREQFYAYSADAIMIIGIAGGNGLEHIEKECFNTVYGVDINRDYLNECEKRYADLGEVFKPICADLLDADLELPCSELLVANLLIEYIGYECFQNAVQIVKPRFVSCIIQVNTKDSFVSDSPYLHVFDRLEEVHCQIDEKGLVDCMWRIGYKQETKEERPLPNGKKLVRLDFLR